MYEVNRWSNSLLYSKGSSVAHKASVTYSQFWLQITMANHDPTARSLVKSAYQVTNYLISQPKHIMLLVLKRTVSIFLVTQNIC